MSDSWWPLLEWDPWGTPCTCGHAMREHVLDWDRDPETDCSQGGCACPEFTVQADGEA